jgi:hypothetical protein
MYASWIPFKNKWGQSKNVVLGFLVPVIMVFGYSVWLQRRKRNSDTTKTDSNTERKLLKIHLAAHLIVGWRCNIPMTYGESAEVLFRSLNRVSHSGLQVFCDPVTSRKLMVASSAFSVDKNERSSSKPNSLPK